MTHKFLKHIILFILLQTTGTVLFAQFEEGKTEVQTGLPRMEGTGLYSTSPKPTNTLTYSAAPTQTSRKIENIVTFKIDENSTHYFASGFSATIDFTVTRKATLGGSAVNESKSLTVNYDTTAGTKYNARAYIVLPESEEVKLTVDGLTITGQTGWDPATVLELENEIRVTRYFNLATNPAYLVPSSVSATDRTDALAVSWSWFANTNNNLSQLEWVYVETEMQDYYNAGGLEMDYDHFFQNNSTRVDVDYLSDSFRIPLLYPGPGKLYYRLRAVLRRNSGGLVTGPWSVPDSFEFDGHETSLNWQSSTSFAENGKSKTVIQYFDGSLRSRQTVTKDNSTGNTVVAETIYDMQGRANLQILPTPTIDQTIQYFENFNRFKGQAAGEDPSRFFDLTPTAVQCNRAPALDSMYGNARYYSNKNPWLTLEAKSAFIPDAQGYAFAETRFMDDATGRIRSQGGVGLQHQIGSGHETKYYYGKPSQAELDALFATEAGEASHYTKNMVQDANGQMSVSYVDMHGRTVATALAGNPTPGIDSIINPSDYPMAASLVRNQLLSPETNIINGASIESVSSILVPAANDYQFTYALDPAILSLLNCNSETICFDCKYDLEISIRAEECGTEAPVVRKYNNLQIVPANEACGTSMGFKGPGADTLNKTISFTEFLATGSYIVRKTLTVNDSLFRIRKDSALHEFLCTTEQHLYDSIVSLMYTASGCGLPAGSTANCDECLDSLGTYSTYRNNYLISIGLATSDTSLNSFIIQQYKSDSLNCVQACTLSPQLSTLAMLRTRMLNDMIPFTGQYAIDSLRDEVTGIATAIGSGREESKYNIFTTAPVVSGKTKPFYKYPKTEAGTAGYYYTEQNEVDSAAHGHDAAGAVILDTMSMYGFAGAFQRSWANSLIYYHPEFSKLKFAEDQLRASYEWADRVMKCETYQAAVDSNYVQPTLSDPYFVNNYVAQDETDMNRYLVNYIGANSGNPSIWRVANSMLLCDPLPDADKPACMGLQSKTGIAAGLNTEQKNKVWISFRTLYMSYRNEMLLKYINTHEAAVLSQTAMDLLQSEDKKLVFATAQDLADQNGWSWWANVANGDTTGTGAYTNANMPTPAGTCAGQRPLWRAKLLQCTELTGLISAGDTATADTIINSILDGLESVCNHSIDAQNPVGASTVKPSYAGQPQSFEKVINQVFATYGITTPPDKYFCNPYTIDFPKPYGSNPPVAINYTNTLDSCACQQFEIFKTEAEQNGYDTTSLLSMNNFLWAAYKDTLSLPLWNGLQQCSSMFSDSCIYTYGPAQTESESAFTTFGGTRCYPPVIKSVEYLNFTSTNNIEIVYSDVAGDSCVLTYRDSTGANTYLPINCTDSSLVLSLPGCAIYSFQIITYSSECDTLKSERAILYPLRGCEDCVHPQITGVTVLQPAPQADSQQVVIAYLTPSLSYDCRLKVYAYSGDSIYLQNSYYVDCNGTDTTLTLDACKKYLFVMDADVSLNVDNCEKIAVSDTIRLDSCWRVNCIRTYTPIILTEVVPLPAIFSCGYTKPCISCDSLDAILQEFRTKYPGFASVPYLSSGTTDAQAAQNSLLARFINFRTGFSKNTIEYLQAFERCQSISGDSIAICNFVRALNDPSDMFAIDTTPCSDVETQAQFAAQLLYNSMKDSLTARFDSLYMAACMSAKYTETFYVEYIPKEYHYTLYYYDQAGNLVKTLPPAAVKPDYGSAYLASVITARNAGTTVTHPGNNENLATNYRYNSLNQVVQQKTPDAGTSKFWYDRLGRLAVSQNAKQATANDYSYTLYDALGRITEVGQLTNNTAMTQATAQDEALLAAWLDNKPAEQITRTFYDNSYIDGDGALCPEYLCQQNLRNRVSYTAVYASGTPGSFDSHTAATYYSYDIHGNVDTLLQDYALGAMNDGGSRFKKMVYDYDLISGKVNAVAYQPGADDAFYHRYAYDAENRITGVETSSDKIYWEREAAYEYYRHGPLARTELGQNRVQGVDYAYTLQGWLKGINSTSVSDGSFDMGLDGKIGSANSIVARDVYGFGLHYFQNDIHLQYDYKAIGTDKKPFANALLTGSPAYTELYNGNIGAMSVNIPSIGIPLLSIYKYDQLNRLKYSFNYKGLNQSTNTWTKTVTNDYREIITYDPNGNIKTYKRNGYIAGGQQYMDNLTYNYIPGTNQLSYVDDAVSSTAYSMDIDDQNIFNYSYDEIGNLKSDAAEGITNIDWNVYGKISSITKTAGTINYTYDASGNRISKTYNGKTTWYVRDASGNVMSIYVVDPAINSGDLTQSEIHLYGSSRLGILNLKKNVENPVSTNGITIFERGNKFFELSNHLGNVLVTVSDRKLQHSTDGTTVDYYMADVITANDYYPFGMMMPGRKYTVGSGFYRYGFNGQERSTELNDNSFTAEFWQYDARLGRRWNVDPVLKVYESPYAAFANNPVWLSDVNGADTTLPAADGRNLTLPTGATFETFQANTTYTHASNGKEVSVTAGSVSAFTVDGARYTARFDPETLGFTSYQDANGKSIVQANTSSVTSGYLNPLSLTGAMYGWDSYTRLNSYINPMMEAKNLYNAGQLSARSASIRRFFFLQDARSKLSPLGDFISESPLFNGKSTEVARQQVSKAIFSNADDAAIASKVFKLRPSTTNWARIGKVGGPVLTAVTQGYVYYTIIRDKPPIEQLTDDMDSGWNPGYYFYKRFQDYIMKKAEKK